MNQPIFGKTDHVEVTIDDLFIESYGPPVRKPEHTTSKPSNRIGLAPRKIPHPTSLLGILLLGGLITGATVLISRRWFA